MKNYRSLLGQAKSLLENAAQERAQVVKEGRNEQWNKAQYESIKEKYHKKAEELTNKMFDESLTNAMEKRRTADKIRKEKSGKAGHGSEKLYHLERAKLMLENLSPEDAVKEYGFIASTLEGTEKDFRHIYEDTLMAKVGTDDVLRISANEEIFKYKPEDEKQSINEYEEAWRLKELNDTIQGHFLYDVEQVTGGKDLPGYDYTDFIDGATQADVNKAKSVQAEEGVRQAMKDNFVSENPYAEDMQEQE